MLQGSSLQHPESGDNRQQLLSEQRYSSAGVPTTLYTYTYDTAGNILTASDGVTTHTYSYTDSNWSDLLTAYDNHPLTYDTIGNPLTYYNGESYTMTWEKGRRLSSITVNGLAPCTYTYDMDGIRSSKLAGGVLHSYVTQSGKVVREVIEYPEYTLTLDFFYDSQGRPYAFRYSGDVNGTGVEETGTYYYLLNLQGDVVGFMDRYGSVDATYTYDAWGNILAMTDSTTWNASGINPLRYRGYYYDNETGFYYLQSRYYDPSIGRFVNADGQVTADLYTGMNLFVYCDDNPANAIDKAGDDAILLVDTVDIGHIGALIQDENGDWWHFYWGSKLDIYRICAKIGLWTPALTAYERYYGSLDLDSINNGTCYSGSYSDMIYYEGDFTASSDNASRKGGLYNVLYRNCSQVTFRILAASDTQYKNLFRAASMHVLPKVAYSFVRGKSINTSSKRVAQSINKPERGAIKRTVA